MLGVSWEDPEEGIGGENVYMDDRNWGVTWGHAAFAVPYNIFEYLSWHIGTLYVDPLTLSAHCKSTGMAGFHVIEF